MRLFDCPVIICGAPRSGSSAVAAAIASQGFWVGTVHSVNQTYPRGTMENAALEELSHLMGNIYPPHARMGKTLNGFMQDPCRVIKRMVEADGYKGGPWMFKMNVLRRHMMRRFDGLRVTVRRSADDNIRSLVEKEAVPEGLAIRRVRYMNRCLDEMESAAAVGVDVERLWAGDTSQIEEVINRFNLKTGAGIVFSHDEALRVSRKP